MSLEWDLVEFTSLVTAKVNAARTDALCPSLNSISQKFDYASFHSSRAIELLRPHKGMPPDDPIAQTIEGMRLLFHQDEAERARFANALFGAQAHTVAFAQCLHSTADYLAKVAYLGLDLRDRHGITLAGHQIGLFKIAQKIATVPELAAVHTEITAYLASPSFKYLAALANTEKHHEIINANYSLSVSVGAVASAGLELKAFTYDGKNGPESYSRKWASEFFEKDSEKLTECTIAVGRALTERLKLM